MTWLLETVALQAGGKTTIDIDSLGHPWILHGTVSPPWITLAHWNGLSWVFEQVVQGYGLCYSFALDSLDHPHVVYDIDPNLSRDMHYAYWNGVSWIYEIIDVEGDLGSTCSIALDSLGRPHVSYEDYSWTGMNNRRDLKHAWRDSFGWHNETVDWQGWVGESNSIAIDSSDRPHISYNDVSNRTLKYAWWDGSQWDLSMPDPSCNVVLDSPTALRIDSTDNPHIAYMARVTAPPDELRYASWNGASWTIEPAAYVTWINSLDSVSLKLDSLDRPYIAYTNHSGYLSFTSKQGTSWVVENIDAGSGSIMGAGASLALDSAGNPHISYSDATYPNLKYARRGMDSIPPTSKVDAIVPYWASSPRIVTATASDGQSRVSNVTLRYRFSPDNSSWGLWNAFGMSDMSPWSWIFTFPDGVGYYEFYSVAVDTGGNIEPPPPLADSLSAFDNTKPSSIIQPIPSYWLNSTSLALTATTSDAPSGVDGVDLHYSFSGNNASWGAWTLYQIDKSPPWSWDFNFPMGAGWYRLYSLARDWAGNVENPPASQDLELALDRTPPTSMVDQILGVWHRSSVNVTAQASDPRSGVASVALGYRHSPDEVSWDPWTHFQTDPLPPWSWLFTFPDGDGFYQFHSIGTDNASNSEWFKDWPEANATFDATPPTAIVNQSPPYWKNASTILTATVSDVTSGAENATLWYCFSLDNSSWGSWQSFATDVAPPWSWLFDFPDGPGHYQFQATAFDVAGNEDPLGSVWEAELGFDPDAPSASLAIGFPSVSNPPTTWVTSSTLLTLTAYDGDGSGVATLMQRIWRDGWSLWSAYSGPFTLTGTDGLRYLQFRACDAAGNAGLAENRTIIVDDTPPATSLSIGEPRHLTGGSFVKSSTPLNLSAMDDGVGSNSTFYRLWSGPWTQWREYSTPFSLAGRDGTWYVEFLSFDYLGNEETIRNETLVLDDTPPATTIAPATGPYTIDTLFTLPATDSGCGLNVTRYRIDGESWNVYSDGFTIPKGEHNISYYSNDMLNNTEGERWLVVTVEGTPTPPEVAVNYKPIVAVMFSIILLVAGVWSSKRRPWTGGKNKVAVAKAFAVFSMPFILVEAVTGLISLSFEPLRIPPMTGWGTGADCAILAVGLLLLILRSMQSRVRSKPSERR